MTNSQVDLGQDATLELRRAILLYGSDRHIAYGSRAFATLHDVKPGGEDDPQPELGPGRLLTSGDLEDIHQALRGRASLTLLPEHVLASTPEAVAWFEPAQERPMFFQTRDESLDTLHGLFPQPALLWIYKGNRLDVYALSEDARPTGETPLYRAPYYNVFDGGSVCVGSTPLPAHHDPSRTSEISGAFFQSAFTHPSGRNRLYRQWEGSYSQLWLHVRASGHFDPKHLHPADRTLQQALEQR